MSRPGFEGDVPETDFDVPDLIGRLDRIELKLDEVLAFRDVVLATAAPLLAGKGKTWLALLAKTRGGNG